MSTEIHGGAGQDLRRDILTTLLPGFFESDAPEWVLGMLREGLGGVCLFGSNIVSPAQVAALTADLRAANPLAVIAIDEEGGDVTRLFFDRGAPFPGNAILGRIDDLELTREVGRAVGEAIAAVGCTMTFAPDADINSNAKNPVIGVRSFGAEPALVSRHTAAWVEGSRRPASTPARSTSRVTATRRPTRTSRSRSSTFRSPTCTSASSRRSAPRSRPARGRS
ncbi:hypothetical protein GCM10025870_27030 [Agromyces marinus]|uniref:Glycoside hydrolase family 3 N-terminal domain-containing protein n=1 Tax=Agromyces marinus TaxID=1389020 RepID=A0ABN6YE42_9MICO|nr:hypothetical protein GCM10025870_27030 [Agromyces marinus]